MGATLAVIRPAASVLSWREVARSSRHRAAQVKQATPSMPGGRANAGSNPVHANTAQPRHGVWDEGVQVRRQAGPGVILAGGSSSVVARARVHTESGRRVTYRIVGIAEAGTARARPKDGP